ncbi:unnamed protein product [Cunninghamella blakesleeana]
MTSVFIHLKYLSINFSCYYRSNLYGFNKTPLALELDERTIDDILQSCPLLTMLEIDSFYMNISDKYTTNGNIIILSNNTTTSSLHDMIEGFTELSSLLYSRYQSVSGYLPNLFLHWLRDHPTQLKELYCQFPTFIYPTEKNRHQYDDSDEDDISIYFDPYDSPFAYSHTRLKIDKKNKFNHHHHKLIYLDYLNSLGLSFQSALSLSYNHFNYICKEINIPFKTITLLDIQTLENLYGYKNEKYSIYKSKNTFYFQSWLTMIPNLKVLKLGNVPTITFNHDEQNIRNSLNINFMHDSNDNQQQKEKEKVKWSCKLQVLIITNSYFKYWNALTDICNTCLLLRKLELDDVIIDNHGISKEQLEQRSFVYITPNDFIIDIPKLKLDELFIKNIFVNLGQSYYDDIRLDDHKSIRLNQGNKSLYKSYSFNELIVNKTNKDNRFFTLLPIDTRIKNKVYNFNTKNHIRGLIKLRINYHFVDLVNFVQNHDHKEFDYMYH